jgi:hypothetical protein
MRKFLPHRRHVHVWIQSARRCRRTEIGELLIGGGRLELCAGHHLWADRRGRSLSRLSGGEVVVHTRIRKTGMQKIILDLPPRSFCDIVQLAVSERGSMA